MFEHSRRAFIRIGALAATGPLIGRLIPVSAFEASAASTEDLFVTMRARLIPCLPSGIALGEHARQVTLAWAQPRMSLLPRARVALHDSMRDLMEQVGPSEDIGWRERPSSPLAWQVHLMYVSWTLGDLNRARLSLAEQDVFSALDNDPAISVRGQLYNAALRQRLAALASSLNVAVDVRLPAIVRLDHPHAWLWTNSQPGWDAVETAGLAISKHLAKEFIPIFKSLANDPRRAIRNLHATAAMAALNGAAAR
jgi:hypothetical protein